MSLLNKSLIVLLGGAGVLHLTPATAKNYDTLVPEQLPGSQRAWTTGSGIAELGTAALLANKKTRRFGAGVAAALFIAVFPGNIQMAYDWRDRTWWEQVVAYGRLPLQLPLVWAALRVRKDS